MPMINGKYVPRPTSLRHGTLFGVLPPGHPAERTPPTEADCDWHEQLVQDVTGMVLFIVGNVRRNYREHKGERFDNKTRRKLHQYAETISKLLGGKPPAVVVKRVLSVLVKRLGLIVQDPEPGPRHNWSMPATAFLDRQDAERLVRDAFWGHYPELPQDALPGTQPDHHA